jgi:isoleucyl-tRNA synthetase
MTLYTAIVTLCKAAAPMVPFITETIYQNIVRGIDPSAKESIHLCDFPTVNEAWIDTDLEANMREVMRIVVLGRAARNASNIKNRQPLSKMYVKTDTALDDFYTEIVRDELNVGSVEYKNDLRVEYSLKPQLKTVGPKFGKLVGGIRKALAEADGADAVAELNENGSIVLDVDGQQVTLGKEDLLIDIAQTEGYATQSDGTVTVMLDTTLTPELVEQGFVAELISKIQTMRKDAGFEVMDRIRVYETGNDRIADILRRNDERIRKVVLADEIVIGEVKGSVKEWKINSEDVTLGVEKLEKREA